MISEVDVHLEEFIDVLLPLAHIMEEHVTRTNSRYWRLGRPRVKIDEVQLEFLIESSFRVSDIAAMFGCSKRTIERRINYLGLNRYSCISENDLDSRVREIIQMHPNCGEKSVTGRLRSYGIRVQRQRIRDSLERVDPDGVVNCMRRVLHRRSYTVRSPNSLWHLDGYHKLIRWKFVIHGAIDGFSRLIMFLKVSNNNRASSVLSGFMEALQEYGLPSRIRTDRGGENVQVSEYMLRHPDRGPGRGSVIAGRSIHNQRIERLWRDLYSGCISFFYNFFYFLEDAGLLNINDPLDLYTLHLVMLPVIQHQLDLFREGWANHSLRMENNKTPLQLWTTGFVNCDLNNREVTGLESDVFHGQHEAVADRNNDTVIVDELPQYLSQRDYEWLQLQLNSTDGFSQEVLLCNYVIATAYIHNNCDL
ncbi:PREDICTED: uncharacterized protein LOC109586726 [Amphimedon queenslandica]|uniref:Integrase catalytic domain-containing protein n=1 Tax=Amphimedon queenslandica TaxID=400682 RepID=A0A1X7TP47_AMPQE|nr:PREDICTED: uncharacterized protein LOC109586726 [Amphimedon queenslandica]|eukprot:XP_019858490.1 PREDICTED: uncharacterized protein LOC109586726 [Amphimedon queenslandica]